MISLKEIRDKALNWGVTPDIADKDYVLGHFLSAISYRYSDELVFKGGTCLRKCVFPGYRFSEDLDFSSINQEFKI
jgi:predicted nucleotidyltransferase component of viral defense system